MYLQLLKDVGRKNVVWKLKRNIYGLKDAPRAWYDEVRSEMKRFCATIRKFDKAVFMWQEKNKLAGLPVSHVDNFSFVGTEYGTEYFGDKISHHQRDSFEYLGWKVMCKDYPQSVYSKCCFY